MEFPADMTKNFFLTMALWIASVALTFHSADCRASILVWMREAGSDVVFTLSGSFDTTGLTPTGPTAFSAGSAIYPDAGGHGDVNFNSGATNIEGWATSARVPSFGFSTPGLTFATSSTGDTVVFNSAGLSLDENYVSGSSLSAEMTFSNTTFAALGVTPGTYVANLPAGQTYTLTSVPEPSTMAMLAAGTVATLLIAGRHRRSRMRATVTA